MTVEQANNISIKQYLSGLNIFSVKEKEHYGMYRSPFRSDTKPSLKVDYRQNLWYDFGTGEGGTMVDLAMKINQCSFAEAMQKLNTNSTSFFFHGSQSSEENNICIREVLPLSNSALLGYLAGRKIDLDAARRQCSEVIYTVNGKPYFAVGFANDTGGYELRNKYFKGCISPKGITSVRNGNDTCCIFEGFVDYLSYLTLKQKHHPEQANVTTERDYIILNSVINLSKAIDVIERYDRGYCFLDNDQSGANAWRIISDRCGLKVSDQSVHYRQYKDLNEYLCAGLTTKHVANKPKFKMKRSSLKSVIYCVASLCFGRTKTLLCEAKTSRRAIKKT